MIEYRRFRNTDPPNLLQLWHACQLGRGAAVDFTSDAFEHLLFSQPYFDPAGLIVACDAGAIVGFVHAGFGSTDDESELDYSVGVIPMLMVRPDYRLRGIGRELVQRAAAYLKEHGAKSITFGGCGRTAGFYLGLYGGSQPAGLLESDTNAAAFMESIGYIPERRVVVYQRELNGTSDLTNRLIVQNRRRLRMQISNREPGNSWWWMTRFGRLDSAYFSLLDKSTDETVASAHVIGLDLYINRWGHRSVGVADVFVPEQHRRNGFAQTLLVEMGKRLRQETITLMESHVDESNEAGIATLSSVGFERTDTGVVYRPKS